MAVDARTSIPMTQQRSENERPSATAQEPSTVEIVSRCTTTSDPAVSAEEDEEEEGENEDEKDVDEKDVDGVWCTAEIHVKYELRSKSYVDSPGREVRYCTVC